MIVYIYMLVILSFSFAFNIDDTSVQDNYNGTDNRQLFMRNRIGFLNLHFERKLLFSKPSHSVKDFYPGDNASSFTFQTLKGEITYPGNLKTPVIFISYDPRSGFMQCIWNCTNSIEDFLQLTPYDTQYVFMSVTNSAYSDVLWMRNRLKTVFMNLQSRESSIPSRSFSQFHFVINPLKKMSNWIPKLMAQWSFMDTKYAIYTEIIIDNTNKVYKHMISKSQQVKLTRLDARYDWLPSPLSKFGDSWQNVTLVTNACDSKTNLINTIALIHNLKCSYVKAILNMQKLGAIGVLVMVDFGKNVIDLNCRDDECNLPIYIPVSSISFSSLAIELNEFRIKYLNEISDIRFFGINYDNTLAEIGWMLYPSFSFLAWQAQWFGYKRQLTQNISTKGYIIEIFNETIMQGAGATAVIKIPQIFELKRYEKIELDMSLSCPGKMDRSCPIWDHTIELKVCCDQESPLCNMEVGRWISPFRRKIGRWLTDISSLLPIISNNKDNFCNFTISTVPWAMPWKPSLNLRFTGIRKIGDFYPVSVMALKPSGSITFDKQYNQHFPLHSIYLPQDVIKTEIYSVITGHGSDEFGCGEFCVTSHHFNINGNINSKTFDNPNNALGCANQVKYGSEPNEHGTWLYGRNGWCDGQQVNPWLIDITGQMKKSRINEIQYYGWFNGTDPNPKKNPGYIINYSYLIYHKLIAH